MSSNKLREVPMSLQENSPYTPTHHATYALPRNISGGPLGRTFDRPYRFGNDDTDTVIVDTKLFNRDTHHFADDDFVCPDFFNRANLGGMTRRFNATQWTYEMRRQAQPILPFLSLGPSSCLRDIEYIRSQGFTLLLAIRSQQSAHARLVSGDKAAAEAGVMADTIDVHDSQDLIHRFPSAIRRINDHLAGVDTAPGANLLGGLQEKRKVLVFCESGNERSAAVAIAYIMVMLNMGSAEAVNTIQQRRFCSSIDDSAKRILLAFDTILSAKRDVERAKRSITSHMSAPSTLMPPPPGPELVKKRSFQNHIEDCHGMADEMEVDGDEDLFFERKPCAPFQDRVA